MKHFLVLVSLSMILFGCNDSSKQSYLQSSSGNINQLMVVMDNLEWEDTVGESVRNVFAAPIQGLANEEPIFKISQMPTQVFSGFATKNRIVLKIEKGKAAGTSIKRDVLATPQTLVVVSGKNNQEIITQINTNASKIIAAFKKEEIREKQRRIKMSLYDTKVIQDQLGIDINFPTSYRIATHDKNFFWIRRDITTGNMDFIIYEVPLDRIKRGDSTVVDIIRMRDSIGKEYIQSSVEGAYMITEEAYAPSVNDITIDNKPTIETKGIWDMKNAFMSGPFINYAIEDKAKNRYVILEGYVFAPSLEKGDYMFELEAIMKSVKLK